MNFMACESSVADDIQSEMRSGFSQHKHSIVIQNTGVWHVGRVFWELGQAFQRHVYKGELEASGYVVG